jgi:hypothetical protein
MNDLDFTGMSEQERKRYTVGELIDALTIDTIVADTVHRSPVRRNRGSDEGHRDREVLAL